jgi:glycine hydroxymethyltransferase
VIAAKAVCLKEALEPSFKVYQQRIVENAKTLAETLLGNGFDLVSGGTDNHLVLMDVRSKGLTGKAGADALAACGITVNKNKVHNDPESAFVTSGIRIGTPAVTTRGMGPSEMQKIGALIAKVLAHLDDETVRGEVRGAVQELCKQFPLYAERLAKA